MGPKSRLGVILHVRVLGRTRECKRDTAWNLWAVWRCPVISYVVSLAQSRIWVVNDNRDSFSFVDKTGPTVTTDVKSNAEGNMEGSSLAYKKERQKQWLRSEQFGLSILYGAGLPLMRPKLTSILERSEKAPDLLSWRTWPRPYVFTWDQPQCSER